MGVYNYLASRNAFFLAIAYARNEKAKPPRPKENYCSLFFSLSLFSLSLSFFVSPFRSFFLSSSYQENIPPIAFKLHFTDVYLGDNDTVGGDKACAEIIARVAWRGFRSCWRG